jgi:hypothetical protein
MEEGQSFRIRSSAPIMNVKDFSKYFYKDSEIERLTKDSFFYMIVQRPIQSFENIKRRGNNLIVDVVQKHNDSKLKITLPLYQSGMLTEDIKQFGMVLQSDFEELFDENKYPKDVHAIKLYKGKIEPKNFVKLLTPEWIIRDHYRNFADMEIEGNITDFLNYIVHYIGISTEQKIVDRLKSHSNLQAILSEESSISESVMNSIELGIIFFELEGTSQYNLISPGDLAIEKNREKLRAALIGKTLHGDKKIFKDAEKAFVSAFKPIYNRIQFKTYPRKKDLLKDKGYSFITYEFIDPFNLVFETSNLNSANGDLIIVTEEKKVQIIKFEM